MNFLKRHKISLIAWGAFVVWATLLLSQNRIVPGPYNSLFRVNTAADTATLTTTQFGPGILVSTPTAAATYTTPTASNICTAFPGVAILAPGTNSNFGYQILVRNVSAGANTITVAAGSGVTLASGNTNTVAQAHTRTFVVVPTACPVNGTTSPTAAVTVYSAQDSAH